MSTTTSSPAAAVAAAAAGTTRICFNAHCKEPISDPPGPRRRGWRLRSGDYADLCERCFYAYEQGNFCDTFHADATGWRNCETCGKRLHCGCIISATIYYLLDAGGVDCVACGRKALGMAPNQMLSSPMLMHQQGYERREFISKNWRPTAGPFPGQWRQGSHIWNLTSTQTDLQQRLSYEFDRPSADRLIPGGRLSVVGHEKKFEEPPERIITTSLGKVSRDKYTNGSTGSEPISTFNAYHREETNSGMQESCNLVAEHEPNSTRKADVPDPSTSSSCVKLEMNPNPIVNSQSPTTLKEESPSLLIGLAASLSSANGTKDTSRFSSNQTARQITPQLSKQIFSQGVIDAELQTQMRNGRPRMDTRTRTQLLPRYWPRITDQELQQISGDSNAVITPLFEKMLSASDAGRIGRLVLPKKCAEAYFPTISQPEGLPLTVQDVTGKEWVFQFRFWPNNNSRMYVLEGVTPCIQSMQLQAGDTVTFSRLDPEGKLIMGFRKASSVASEQESQTPNAANGGSTPPEGNNRTTTIDSSMNIPLHASKSSLETVNPIGVTEESTLSKFTKAGFIQKDGSAAKSSPVPGKRKASTLGPKNKRLHIENEDSKELKPTWEEAQELLRPPPNSVPNVVVIDGHEVEEYEEAPVLGRRTYFTKNQAGENFQWAQCDVCSKWRKLPVDVLLPFRWTCSDNKWDPEYKRSSCSSAQELSLEQILDLVPTKTGASKRAKVKAEAASLEASGGLDTLANIALGEGENQPSASQQTTKHPRHRPGCSCIVCIQPPSGKGPKHKQTCTCNVCLTVKRRFRTLMLRREKRQSEKEAENARKQQEVKQSTGPLPHEGEGSPSSPGVVANGSPQKAATNNDVSLDEGSEHRRTSLSPLKAPQIDLNIQPEREEESSPRSDVGNIARLLRDATQPKEI